MARVSIEEFESLLGAEMLAEKRATNAALFGTAADVKRHMAAANEARERMKAYSPRALLAYIENLESMCLKAERDEVRSEGAKNDGP